MTTAATATTGEEGPGKNPSDPVRPAQPVSYSYPSFIPPTLAPPPRLLVPVPTADGCLPVGSRVNRGDALSTSTAADRPIPLAPAAGTLVGIRDVDRLGVARSAAIEIEVDATASGETKVIRPTSPPADLPAIVERLRRGGVQANRHISPDLLGQLQQARDRKIDTILCNLLDPAGESDLMATVARAAGNSIVAGANALARASGASRIWFAADARAAGAITEDLRAAGIPSNRAKVIELDDDYPQADPSLLLYTLLGRRLTPGVLPTRIGVMLLDGPAAAAVGRCVVDGHPLLDVTVEVRESDREACSVRTVPVGTPLRYVLEQLWLRPERLTLRAGAALRDVRASAEAVIDGVGELSIDAGPTSPVINPDPCIRCGWCVEACPVRIHPAGLLEAAQDNDLKAARWFGAESCIECGICSYVCPSRLPLLGAIRDLRVKIARQETSLSPSPSGRGSG